MSTVQTVETPPASDREIVLSRVFDAPRELVWQAWTDPRHTDQWWGPRGFSNTTHEHDLRVGGVWRHTMHGPDGTDYPNRKLYEVIDPPARLVYSHGWDREDGELFRAVITFSELGSGKTEVEMRSIFPTAADRDKVVREYGAIEGGKQTLERLGEYLAGQTAGHLSITLPDDTSIRIERTFAAPPELLYEVMTRPEHLLRWWGGCDQVSLVSCDVDLRVGGGYRHVLRDPAGNEFGFHGTFLELEPGRRTVQTFVFEPYPDAEATETAIYESVPGGTRLTVTVRHKSKENRDGHYNSGMEHGLRASYAALDSLLGRVDREAATSRVLDASPAAVYRALTTPELLAQWWGPQGFTSTVHACDIRPGGRWRLTMHGPDGRDFANEYEFVEAGPQGVVLRRVAATHDFRLSIKLTSRGSGTRVDWQQLFTTAQELDECRQIVVPANEQNLDRLAAVVAAQQA